MILEAIIGVFKAIALFIINRLPAFPNFASFVSTSLTPVFDVLYSANYFIDLRVCAACLLAMIVFANIEFVWSIIMWIVRKIPGVS